MLQRGKDAAPPHTEPHTDREKASKQKAEVGQLLHRFFHCIRYSWLPLLLSFCSKEEARRWLPDDSRPMHLYFPIRWLLLPIGLDFHLEEKFFCKKWETRSRVFTSDENVNGPVDTAVTTGALTSSFPAPLLLLLLLLLLSLLLLLLLVLCTWLQAYVGRSGRVICFEAIALPLWIPYAACGRSVPPFCYSDRRSSSGEEISVAIIYRSLTGVPLVTENDYLSVSYSRDTTAGRARLETRPLRHAKSSTSPDSSSEQRGKRKITKQKQASRRKHVTWSSKHSVGLSQALGKEDPCARWKKRDGCILGNGYFSRTLNSSHLGGERVLPRGQIQLVQVLTWSRWAIAATGAGTSAHLVIATASGRAPPPPTHSSGRTWKEARTPCWISWW